MTSHATSSAVMLSIALMAWSLPSRADIAGSCDLLDALITCDAKDVGKPCQGAGQCHAEVCGNLAASTTVYKCDVCRTTVSAPDGGCDHTTPGTPCGDGGTCEQLQSFCTSAGGYACVSLAAPRPTGPPAGEGGGSGCDVGPRATGPGAIALGLLAVGMIALIYDRRRKRRR
jgi:hypothetical protein